jgi:PAS domain S-box-containing protein
MDMTKKELLEEMERLRKKVEDLESGHCCRKEGLYRGIIASAPVGIAVMDADMTVRLWNPYFEEYTGIKSGDIVGKNLFEAVPGLKASGWDSIYAGVLSTGRPFIRRGYKYVRWNGPKKGEELYQNARILPLVTDGAVSGVMAMVEDVTAARRAEERLWTLSYAIEQSPMPVIIMDASWNIEYVNRSFIETLGYTLDEVAGKNMSFIRSDVHPPEFYRNLQAEAANGVWLGDLCAAKKNGERHWMQISVSPIRDYEGGITNFVSLTMDDTGLRHAVEALERSEASLRKAQALGRFGSWEWDITEGPCNWSDEARRILGFAREAAPFEAFKKAVHPEDRKPFDEAVNEALYKGGPFSVDLRVRLSDGLIRHCHASGDVSRDNAGRPVRFFGTIHDVTDSVRLSQETLKAQKLESIGVMAGGVAHAFNNILMTILSNLYLAKTRMSPADGVFRHLLEAEKAALRARGLTTQMLTFSMGGLPVKKTLSIGDVVRDAADHALSMAGAPGTAITPVYRIPDVLPNVEADEGQMRQVINNLVANAVQAMPQGGGLSIACEAVSVPPSSGLPVPEGSYVRVSIEDEGTGIPEDLLQKIFDPFFTTRESVSGLGLSTAYSIVKNHGGCIAAESKGKGAAFRVYIPAAGAAADPVPAGLMQGKGRVLVMDDEAMIREAVGELLAHLGYSVDYAADGGQAIEMYRAAMDGGDPFNAVIMDLTIPHGMGGKEAISRLREIDPSVKAIVSSGYSNDPVMSDYRNHGFLGCIAKPYRIEELSDLVYRTVNG